MTKYHPVQQITDKTSAALLLVPVLQAQLAATAAADTSDPVDSASISADSAEEHTPDVAVAAVIARGSGD